MRRIKSLISRKVYSLISSFFDLICCLQEIVDWYLSIRGARLKFLTPYLYDVDTPMVSLLSYSLYLTPWALIFIFKTIKSFNVNF